MQILNVEFKASSSIVDTLEKKLNTLNPSFIGEDHQTDTYFNVHKGRLKLREGIIENALIYYERENTANAKSSSVILYKHQPENALKNILAVLHGIKVIVSKKRKIYFMDNVKFHFDRVEGLGSFIEVEAIDKDNCIGLKKLNAQCEFYKSFFDINESDIIGVSYSDMIMSKQKEIAG